MVVATRDYNGHSRRCHSHAPIRGREVDRLAAVEAVAEAAVVRLREGHDEVAGLLSGLVHRHLVLDQDLRANLRRDVVLEVRDLCDADLGCEAVGGGGGGGGGGVRGKGGGGSNGGVTDWVCGE